MGDGRITFVSLLLGLFSYLIAFLEIILALLNVQADYVSRRLNIIRSLCLQISTAILKRLDRRGRQIRKTNLEEFGLNKYIQVLGGIPLPPK